MLKACCKKCGPACAGGFTLLELVMAISLFSVVAAAMMACFSRCSTSDTFSNENITARSAATRIMDSIRDYASSSFEDTFAYYNSHPYDDPDGYGTAAGGVFTVEELNSPGVTASAQVQFPELEGHLREDFDDPELGLPRDLNGDGIISDVPVDATYNLLPVRVVITWNGIGGQRTYSVVTVITRKSIQR